MATNDNQITKTKATKPTAKTRKKVRRKRKKGCLFPALIIIFVLIVCVCLVKKYTNTDMSTSDSESTIDLNIPEGSSVSDIATLLEDNGVIDSATHFKIMCKLNSQGSEFKSGYYTFTNHMEFDSIANILNAGSTGENAMRLTIKEGMWLSEIADEVASLGVCTRAEFMEAANSRDYDYDFVADIPDRDNLLEGYLYPNTYFLYDGMSAHDIVDMLLNEFDREINKNDIISKAKSKDKTLDEIVTIASLIEAEVKYEPERELVSSVIYNRLNSDTKLQIDASVIYALGERVTRVYEKDLKTQSDYNTYYVKGLPKGPINCPRIASIVAACQPASTDYMFYVVEDTQTGQHAFSATYDEFLKDKEKYLAKVN